VAENDLKGIGRPPRAPGDQQANAEEMLAELVRLVESSGLAPKRRPPPVEPPPVEIVPEQSLPDTAQPLEMKPPAPSIEAPSRQPKETALVGVEPIRATRSDDSPSNDPNAIGLAAGRRSGAWTFRVSALALAAAAAVGAIFWLEQIKSEPPKGPPLLSAARSPAMAPPRANPSVATSSEAGATPQKDLTQPAEGKAVSPEQRPTDPNARASLENPPPSQDSGPTAGGLARPEALPAAKPPAAPVDTPAAAAPAAAPPPAASQSPEKAAPAVLLSPEPAATPSPAAAEMGVGRPSDAPLPPVRPAPKAAVQASGAAQRPTPKLELPTKLSGPTSAHAAAKAGATGVAAPQSRSEPLRLGAAANPENKAAQVSVEPSAAAPAQSEPAPKQPNANPVARAFGTVAGAVGAVAGLIPFVPH
jgi:hypothetical protein